VSSIFQGQMRLMTGQLQMANGAPNALAFPYITDTQMVYGDWHGDTGATLYLNKAGQVPSTIASDADRDGRLRAALALPMTGLSNVSVSETHACALDAGGAVKCWGRNDSCQLGNGSQWGTYLVPQQVVGLTSGATSVVSGWGFSCALLQGGSVKCWGVD